MGENVFSNNTAAEDEAKRILIVDDDAVMMKVIKKYLDEDYRVSTALSGKVAYKFLEKKKVDLILLDFEMPGETGPDVMREIRSMENGKDVPIVFLTGAADEARISQIHEMSPQGYFVKPVEQVTLKEKIRALIGV